MQDFLQRFGYFPAGGPGGVGPEAFRAARSRALVLYQRRHSLPVTGELDERTNAQMSLSRCGLPDLHDGLAFCTRGAWPSPQLTYAFGRGTRDLRGSDELQAVRRAFATWAAAVPITFTEVRAGAGPDILISWRPAGDPDLQMGGGVLAHADFPPACSVVTSGLPKPLHFDDAEHRWSIGAAPNAFDVETVALHQIGHLLGLPHSDVQGSVMFPSFADNRTNRALTRDDLLRIRQLYPTAVLPNGVFAIRQRNTGRHLDAHQNDCEGFRVVTRPALNTDTQRWQLTKIGTVFVIRQRSNGRFLDAHESPCHEFRLMTRTAANSANQQWIAMADGDGAVTLRQLSSRRFAEANESESADFALVTRPAANGDSQKWLIRRIAAHTFTLRQKDGRRFLDAHETAASDFAAMTRPQQDDDTQRWIFSPVGAVYTVIQKSTCRSLDAPEAGARGFSLVTRPGRCHDAQRWILMPAGSGSFTIQQLSTGGFVDAHESAAQDYRVVTRGTADDDTQRWMFDKVGDADTG